MNELDEAVSLSLIKWVKLIRIIDSLINCLSSLNPYPYLYKSIKLII
jgi:hypothetical protein